MYCWARNTYFAAFDRDLPEVQDRSKTMVSYYQWVPFFLVIVAFMFYSPCLLWSNVQPGEKRNMFLLSRFLQTNSQGFYGYGIIWDLITGHADVSFKKGNYTLELEEFVRDFMKMDGIFVLRMITIHSGVLICTEVVDTMWDQFLAEQGHRVIVSLLDENGKDEIKEERSPSAGAMSLDIPVRRKTSVLVPLVSREDLTQIQEQNYLRPPSRLIP
uniref:Innexin n=1 Tax=Heterorhabditis bacteriophora TaxID=37862 RepID=A0A1I7XCW6_HETBA